MEMAKVTSKGQITIPISIRKRLEINEGDKILFINKTEGVMMVNPDVLQSGQLDELTSTESVLPSKFQAPKREGVAAATTANYKSGDTAVAPAAYSPPTEPARHTPPAVYSPPTEPVRHTPPTVKIPTPPQQTEKEVGGVDLSSLLDDIRSIGSNI